MPSILGGLVTFGVVIGPAYALAMEREDGTLLRSKAVPNGLLGYVTGQSSSSRSAWCRRWASSCCPASCSSTAS